jgi:acyl-CoA hydrolase
MGIGDANLGGNVHGGVIMHLCDEAAGIAAVRHSGRRAVTAAMDRMTFMHPVYVGQLVTLKAMVNAAWRTSMEVGVRVESEDIRSGEIVHTCSAYLTMVALDDEGRPTAVPGVARRPRRRRVARARLRSVATVASPRGSGSRRREAIRRPRRTAPRTAADATP